MIIQSLTLQNFRNIGKEQTFQFNRHFTVVIGVNGKGKSTLLHGLRIACGCFMLGLPKNEVKTRTIQEEDIHLEDTPFTQS